MTEQSASSPPAESADLSAWLAERPPRVLPGEALQFGGPNRPIALERPEEIAALAIGTLILQRAAEHEGTRLPAWLVNQLRERLTQPFSSRDVMNMEVEAYGILTWLAGISTDATTAPPPPVKTRELISYDPDQPVIELLRRAIGEEFDVEIQYYTQSRGELTRRRISPNHIEAETYLHAYCHSRREERVFRISRVAEIKPVDGKPLRAGGTPRRAGQGQLEL